MQQPLNPSIAAAERSKTDDNGEAADKFRRAKKRFAPFPGRDAARSPCEALLRRTGIIPKAAFATAPALQRTAPQELRATLRPSKFLSMPCRHWLRWFVLQQTGPLRMLYAILCYHDEDFVGSWSKEQDAA